MLEWRHVTRHDVSIGGAIQETNMSKSHDAKKSTKKAPQKTLEEKRQAKRDKKNMAKSFSATA
jgi:hypothetical protein